MGVFAEALMTPSCCARQGYSLAILGELVHRPAAFDPLVAEAMLASAAAAGVPAVLGHGSTFSRTV
jgi:hypothetical protein